MADCTQRPATISLRGLSLLAVDFLTRHHASECVVTTTSLPIWDAVFDLFPKTLFHAFCTPVRDPPSPNVICHGARFDCEEAARWGARGAPYNLVFTGEGMDLQAAVYRHAAPLCALLLVTEPVQEYIAGELAFPVHCAPGSGLCGLVPAPGRPEYVPYAEHLRRIRGPRADSEAAEHEILTRYTLAHADLKQGGSVELFVESTRACLPRQTYRDVVFWQPPPPVPERKPEQPSGTSPPVTAGDLEALIMSALEAVRAQPACQ